MGAIAMMMSGGAAGGGGSFTAHKTLTIDHTKVGASNATNFPMLVSETIAALKTTGNGGSVTNASGHDIVFSTDAAGTSLLSWEIVKYVPTTGEIVAFVKVPSISHTVDTVIYMPYGNAGITTFQGGSTGAAWNSGYKTVIHGGDGSSLVLTDSTSNGNNGTNNNGATAAAGPNGLGAISFTAGSSQYITTPNTINVAYPLWEAWVKFSSNPGTRGSVIGLVQGNGSATADKDLAINTDGTVSWYVFKTTGITTTSPGSLSTGSWHYIVGLDSDSTTPTVTDGVIFIDGVNVGNTIWAGSTFSGYTGANFQINGVYNGSTASTYMTNLTSEARISLIPQGSDPSDYVTATYNNISSPSTFYAVT